MRAPGDLAARVEALERRLRRRCRSRGRRSGSAGQGRSGSARSAGRSRPRGSGAACTAARSPRPPSGSASCRARRRGGRPACSTPLPFATSSKIACDTSSRGPSESVNSSHVGVQQHGAVGPRRLGDRVALHVLGPRAAVRVVLERVEVARLGAEVERDLASPRRSRRGGWSRARRAPARAGSSGRRRRARPWPPRPRARRRARRQPCSAGSRLSSGLFGSAVPAAALEGLAQRLRDRVPGAVADLEQPVPRGAAAAGEPVAAVRARERDAVLLEPVDRARRVAGQRLAPAPCPRSRASCARRRLACGPASRPAPSAAWMPPCAFEELFGLQRRLRRDGHARARPLRGHGGGEAGGPAADHEHVECRGRRPTARLYHGRANRKH